MKNIKILACIIFIWGIIVLVPSISWAQCSTSNGPQGVNLLRNGDFEAGLRDFSYDASYTVYQPCGSGCWSAPGKLYVGNDTRDFNSAFNVGGNAIPDHTPGTGNNMLMIDGLCSLGIKLWAQTVTVNPGTTYYFIFWYSSIINNSPAGALRIDINGTESGSFNIPAAPMWTPATIIWTAPMTTTSALVSIENTQTTGCNSAVDFALDDMSFSAGCFAGSLGPVPNLGPDRSLCGGNSPITLTSGIPYTTNLRYRWSTGATTSSINVSTPGTYALCVDSLLGGAAYTCVKSDLITITSNYTVNLGSPQTLCSPSTALLDAVFTGAGVTYTWRKNGTLMVPPVTTSSMLVNSSGTYSVVVNDPACGTQTSSVAITSNAATPVDQTRCFPGSVTLSVGGTGVYRWYNTAGPTGGTVLGLGSTLSVNTPGTYYVQDTTTFNASVGPPLSVAGFMNSLRNVTWSSSHDCSGDVGTLYFNVHQNLRLDTITVFYFNSWCGPGVIDAVQIRILNSIGVDIPGSPFTGTRPCSSANGGSFNSTVRVKIPIRANLSAGQSYMLRSGKADDQQIGGTGPYYRKYIGFENLNGSGGQFPTTRGFNFPTNYSNILSIVANSNIFNVYDRPDFYPAYFDWKVSVGTPCARIPVRAINYCPLPIYFLDFNVLRIEQKVVLKWRVTGLDRDVVYLVERSTDGQTFETIGKISEDKSENNKMYQEFTDAQPLAGVNYYRITIKSGEGLSTSSIKSINTHQQSLIEVFPNPFSGTTSVHNLGSTNPTSYSLSNVAGTVLATGVVSNGSETQIGAQLPSGMYILVTETDGIKEHFRIMKE